MILDVAKFCATETPYWDELETHLDRLDADSAKKLDLAKAQRFHYLYRRAAYGLTALERFPSETQVRSRVELLVARAYAEIHEVRQTSRTRNIAAWFRYTFPQTFRRHLGAFGATCFFILLGVTLGVGIVLFDYESKALVLPFSHLAGDPSERVAWEESVQEDRMDGGKTTFSAVLMQNNIRVTIFALALGMTFGIGTGIMLFYNGVILGAVACDYIMAGETTFLMGWLLPHGSVEIPAMMLGGQAGMILAFALIGWGSALPLRHRLREVRSDLVTLVIGAAILLVWAGIIESFFSQYHEPYLPYSVKIGFGATQLAALYFYLFFVGRRKATELPAS